MDLDKVLHQPVRTRIVAFIAAHGETSFTDLKKALDITDGNLEAHMKKLVHAGYIEPSKATSDKRPLTLYALSAQGEAAFVRYVDAIQKLLQLEK